MVGVGDGTRNMLARCSVVGYHGEVLLDTFGTCTVMGCHFTVAAKEQVVDYRTHVSGVRRQDLKDGVACARF